MASQSKPIYFNIDTEKELLDFANKLNFSNWVKGKIRNEIQFKELNDQIKEKLAE